MNAHLACRNARLVVLLELLAISMCLMVVVNASAVEASSYQYVSPVTGSQNVSPLNNIVIREGRDIDPASVTDAALLVEGSTSGTHEGTLVLSDDGRTLVFNPAQPFAPGEHVTVTMLQAPLAVGGGALPSLTYDFSVAMANPMHPTDPLEEEMVSGPGTTEGAAPAPNFRAPAAMVAQPADTPPTCPNVQLRVSNDPDPGYVFATPGNSTTRNNTNLLIVDNYAMPIFYRLTTRQPFDFKKLDDGRLVYYDSATEQYYAMNSRYEIVDSFTMGNGYVTDEHDMQVLPNNHALLFAYDPEPVDMSQVVPGGNPAAIVTGLVIQEIDQAKNVVFQWRSWDHFQITDQSDCRNILAANIDYVHGNSLAYDFDGNLLVSCRFMNEITKINRQTGEIIWRFGKNARNNQFTILDDPLGFSDQHDARRLPNGHLTLFDNHSCIDPKNTRALEYEMDDVNKIARLVWVYHYTPDQHATATGNVQRRASGQTLVGWGSVGTPPNVTELHPDGSIAWEIQFWPSPARSSSYRSVRFPWRGTAFTPNVDLLDFGRVPLGQSALLPLVVTNNTASPITFTSFVTLDPAFSVVDAPPITVAAGGNVTVQAKFTPGAAGDVHSTLYVRSATTSQLIAYPVVVQGSGCELTPLSFDLNPNTINLHSMGHWVTGTLEPEPPASPADIDIASVLLNGSVPVDASAPTSIGDADNDGRPDLTVKFDRAAFELTVAEGESVPVTVSGAIGAGCFEATDQIRVVRGHVSAPNAGALLQGGSTFEVRWDTPPGVQTQSVAVLFSADDGANWELAAQALPNTGSYVWTVPGAASDQARVAVVLVESSSGDEVDGVLGVSDRFVITSPLGVGDPTIGLALHGAAPNPSRGLNVSFSLATSDPATLAVFDVSGRAVSTRQVGGLGAGRHLVAMAAPGTLAPGVYLVHLLQGGHELIARAVVIQ